MTQASTAEDRLARLLERLITAAEASLAAGDVETARATVEEVRAVDPDNARAAQLQSRLGAGSRSASGERALMTLLFADLVGSTMLSEQVEPEQLRDLFTRYRATAREAVERYGGYVMKYMGDGILAGFGYPEAHEDDARRAVLAGLEIVAGMQAMRDDLQQRLHVAPQVRVGIHTGRVVVADLSDERSSDERDSIVGAAPNLAARIQGVASPDQVVISDVTQHLVDADFHLHSLGEQQLKGISRPVEAFSVERPRHAGARFHAERYHHSGLVERSAPLAQLVDAWEAIRTGPTSPGSPAFLIVGEAGIGKTRLVAELVDAVEDVSGGVMGAGCLPYYSNVALWPITQMLERVIASGGDRDRMELLVEHLQSLDMDPARVVPFLGPLIDLHPTEEYPAPQMDPAAVLDQSLQVFAEWLTALGSRTPRLFVVEDLHWADPSTLALLGRLVDRASPGVMIVATTRDRSAIEWSGRAHTIALDRLADSGAARLVDSLAGDSGMTEQMRDDIVQRAEGIPLFVEELTRSCLDESRADPMPLRLQELFTWRLRAPGVDLPVVQAAATVGPTFRAQVVGDVVEDPALVDGQLARLVDGGIIEAVDPGDDLYRFRHALMRDAAYETQTLDARAGNHARVASVLGARGAEPAVIAEHLDLAGDAQGAAGQYLLAAQAEQSRGAHTEAAELLTRALDVLQTLPESQQRDLDELTDRMLRALSVSAMRGYAAPEVQADHRRAEVLAARLEDRPEVLPSLIATWAFWLASGELGTSQGLIERLSRMVNQSAFSWFAPEVESCAGFQAFFEGDLLEAQRRLLSAMDGFAARPDDQLVSPFWPLPNDPVAVSAVALACIGALRGLPEAQTARWEQQALARAEAIGFPRGPWTAAFVKTYLAWLRRFRGEQALSRNLGAEVVGIGQEHGYAYWTLLGTTYMCGPTPDSPDRQYMEQAVTTMQAMGQQAFAASHLAALGEMYHADGDLDGAREHIQAALDLVTKTGEQLHLPELLRHRAAITLRAGGPASEAVADLRAAVDVAERQGSAVTGLRAALDLARLPEGIRPPDWREILRDCRERVPTTGDETRAAEALLQ